MFWAKDMPSYNYLTYCKDCCYNIIADPRYFTQRRIAYLRIIHLKELGNQVDSSVF